MKYALLALLLAGCAAPAPKPTADPSSTAIFLNHVILLTPSGPIRRCTYTVFGNDRLLRTSDFCPPIIEVTPDQVRQAREQLEAPIP